MYYRRARLFAGAVLIVATLQGASIVTATGPVPPDPLASSTWSFHPATPPPVRTVPLQSPFTMTLAAGEHRYLVGSVDATVSGVTGADQQARIHCRDAAGADVPDEIATPGGGSLGAQNNTGSELQVSTRYLLTAPAAGTYTCALETKVTSSQETPSTTYTLQKVNGSGSVATYLDDYFDGPTNAAWQHWQEQHTPGCPSNDEAHPGGPLCQYVVSGTPASVMAFTNVQSTTGVTMYGGLQLSECKYGSETCNSTYWGAQGVGTSTVYGYLRTVQLDASGNVCGQWAFSTAQTVTIPFATHHRKLHFTLSAANTLGCSSSWLASFYVKVQSGDPIKVEAWRDSNIIALRP